MNNFNPDEYLKNKAESSFDPDAYLKEKIQVDPSTIETPSELESAGYGFSRMAWGGWDKNVAAAIEALFNINDPRPFSEKYQIAKQAYEIAKEKAWNENPKAYAAGAVGGTVAGGTMLGAVGTGALPMAATGAFVGAGEADPGEALAGAGTGAIASPLIEKGAIPLAKYAGGKVADAANYLAGDLPANAWGYTKDLALGMNEGFRTKMREYGGKIRNLADIPKRRDELRIAADEHAKELLNILEKHKREAQRKADGVIMALDIYQHTFGEKAVTGPEISLAIQKSENALANTKEWLDLNDIEKGRIQKTLKNLKRRVMDEGDLTLKETDNIRKQLQDLLYADTKRNLTGSVSVDPGGKVVNPRTRKVVVGLERGIRDLIYNKAEEIGNYAKIPNIGQKLRNIRDAQHKMEILDERMPNVTDLVSLANEGKLSTRTAELTNFMNAKPENVAHKEIQNAWAQMKPDFEEFNTLAHIDPNRTLSRGATQQFRAGAVADTFSQGPIPPVIRNYVLPRAMGQLNPQVNQMVGYLGDQVGIPGAIASEELTNAQNSADDISIERILGEAAPQLESFMAPSPVMTSKGRARSAVVDRSGVRARIVDPMERNAIRDDIWHNENMSTVDKMKKVDGLNKTEKIDLDNHDDIMSFPELPQVQVNAPQDSAPSPYDIYKDMNAK